MNARYTPETGKIRLTFQVVIKDGWLSLEVSDNGRGFDLNQKSEGYGLGSMRARAEAIGRRFEITSRPEKGTIVRLGSPLARRQRWPGIVY
ncbi:MAG: sensor histidine kinase [Blastocatellales bacterium]